MTDTIIQLATSSQERLPGIEAVKPVGLGADRKSMDEAAFAVNELLSSLSAGTRRSELRPDTSEKENADEDVSSKAHRDSQVLLDYLFEGETFDLLIEPDAVTLVHPKWSLTGFGTTLLEAEENVRDMARVLVPVDKATPLEKMSIGALDRLDFMLRIV